jgi:hypothetical protein
MVHSLNNTEDHIVGFSTYFTKATASIRNEQSTVKQLLSIQKYVCLLFLNFNKLCSSVNVNTDVNVF